MRVWIQGQLPAGCELALSHWLSAALHHRRISPLITLCFGANGLCIAEWMDCISYQEPSASAEVLLGMELAPRLCGEAG